MRRLIWILATLMGIGLMLCAGTYADLMEGLVGAWTFSDGTAKDETGNKHDGRMVGEPKSVVGRRSDHLLD